MNTLTGAFSVLTAHKTVWSIFRVVKALRALKSGDTYDLRIEFKPVDCAHYQDVLRIGKPYSHVTISLGGEGLLPEIKASPFRIPQELYQGSVLMPIDLCLPMLMINYSSFCSAPPKVIKLLNPELQSG